jgi:antitoxin MazE
MKATISKWGNSLAVRIPSKAVERLNVSAGQDFWVDVKDDSLVFSKVGIQVIPLKNLLEGMKNEKELFGDAPVGNEIW